MRRPQTRGVRRPGRTVRVESDLWELVLREVARRNREARAADPAAPEIGISEVLRDLLRAGLAAHSG